jgi:hypothetical protein
LKRKRPLKASNYYPTPLTLIYSNITNINLILIDKERIIKDLKMKKSMLEKEVKEHDDMFLQSSRAIQSLIDEKNEQIARHIAKIDELKDSSNNVQG